MNKIIIIWDCFSVYIYSGKDFESIEEIVDTLLNQAKVKDFDVIETPLSVDTYKLLIYESLGL